MIQLTDVAREQVKRLMERQGRPGAFLRVGVKGGGCSGMLYDVRLDDRVGEFDRVFEADGLKIVSDVKSLLYVDGMTMDFSNELVGGGFRFVNPKATGSCGCGTSFSV